jgi:magnesium chelatase subunit I
MSPLACLERMTKVNTAPPDCNTLGALIATGYQPRSVKSEIRTNLINALRKGESVFQGIWGYEDTVIPDLERAILSGHHMLLLGLRGQAKTRLARMLVDLLDEWIPCLKGCELPEDPLAPITFKGKQMVGALQHETPIYWLHRSERYVEKLATPDVSIADLIGDVDPIKAAHLKLSYSDEEAIHYGLIPRAHRGIFVINELPDLQPRIQVSLFNILQEGDIQIRGFVKRLHLDIAFLFTANPEDYTNRGSIITPLKDRIDSQILTHYPTDAVTSKKITLQEIRPDQEQRQRVVVPSLIHDILDRISFEARECEWIDQQSGVSARLNISAYENLLSAVERRTLLNKESHGVARLQDFWAIIPALTGKVELLYEGEQEGPYEVAMTLINRAVQHVFLDHFPHPEKWQKTTDKDPYGVIMAWFQAGHTLGIMNNETESSFSNKLQEVVGLMKLTSQITGDPAHPERLAYAELALHGMAGMEMLGRHLINGQLILRDDLAGALDDLTSDE